MNKLMRMLALACAAWLALPAGAARAAYPDKPIRLIVSFPPGSGTDSNARYVAKKMEERLGVAVTVENRPGGNSFIAAQAVAAADPDGYTLLLASNSPVATNAAMFKHLPYDPVKDFAPVARLGYGAMALAVKADAPYKTVADLVNAARQRPGELNFGSGSASYQIATELFLSMGGIKANHVPYRGAAPAMNDTMAGQTQVMFPSLFSAYPYVKSGKLRAMAVAGTKRSPLLPQVPTLEEVGVKGVDISQWYALFAPAGTPRPVVDQLNKALLTALADKEVARRIEDHGATVEGSTPEALGQLVRNELAKWRNVVQKAQLIPD